MASLKHQKEEENFSYAIQLAMSNVLPQSLKLAIELGLLDIIAKAGDGAKLSASEIAAQMPTKSPEVAMMLDRLLGFLATHSVVNCFDVTDDDNGQSLCLERVYGLSPVSKFFVTNEDDVSLVPFFLLQHDEVVYQNW